MSARFDARAGGFRQDSNPKLEVRRLAGALAAFAHQRRWGCPIGPANIIGLPPG